MARRSSARLRGRESSTPKRVSLSHDLRTHTPRTAPSRLAALYKTSDEIPGAFPRSVSPVPAVHNATSTVPVKFGDETPRDTTPIRPTEAEMHPQLHHQSTTKPLEEARYLGFSKLGPHTEPVKRSSTVATLQGTPTRASKTQEVVEAPKFQFTFGREQSLELSPDAKKLMYEKREEALKIRAQMVAAGEGKKDLAKAIERKIATPKSKKTRFSEVHMDEFRKMDSIAGHASAFRADPNRKATTPSKDKTSITRQIQPQAVQTPSKSLKRSPSKAKLDEPDAGLPQPVLRSALKRRSPRSAHAPKATTPPDNDQASRHSESPNKRTKRKHESGDMPQAAQHSKSPAMHETSRSGKNVETNGATPKISSIASPTQASTARAASAKTAKSTMIPYPSFPQSPAKSHPHECAISDPKPAGSLFARSPSKQPPAAKGNFAQAHGQTGPLLLRTPTKAPHLAHGKTTAQKYADESTSSGTPLLSRSPVKLVSDQATLSTEETKGPSQRSPLLSRSPLKLSIAKTVGSDGSEIPKTNPVPFLSRSPTKITMPEDGQASQKLADKSPGANLMGHFKLLRSSPVKSILRSPQRLYSNDPAKVAAGTHFATPPKTSTSTGLAVDTTSAITASAQKHVDFTSSTKARYERAQSEVSSTPSKGSTPEVNPPESKTKRSPKTATVQYPTLPMNGEGPTLTPQKRRLTATPADFTFRAGTDQIIFRPSPNAPRTAINFPPTIRHVSAGPTLTGDRTGSKKRKFEFENGNTAEILAPKSSAPSDNKENTEHEDSRPAKRVRANVTEDVKPQPKSRTLTETKRSARMPTLGVKPRGVKTVLKEAREKRPATITQSRLNALAQPKKRG